MQPQIQEGSDKEEASGEARLSPGKIKEVSGEMPAGAAVNGKWVLGENPRILFFPHVTPEADADEYNKAALARITEKLSA